MPYNRWITYGSFIVLKCFRSTIHKLNFCFKISIIAFETRSRSTLFEDVSNQEKIINKRNACLSDISSKVLPSSK